ncbi:1-phosphofructokinase [Paenibacillus senegalimassiliensis]|uniref:1-phosphofructokinase n=1 Tax=Paenibacillus senegalimassiliensis TaxID=1737426 RepID=UPI00073F1543|nr:1-phosphofructokinase [Paenibacillus senegalimassiliensis]
MIYTITLNPSIDYIVEIEELMLGGLNRIQHEAKLPGGKGINVSRILKELGTDSLATGFLGGFTGSFIEQSLEKLDIERRFITVAGDTRINIKLKHGEETEINGPGPQVTTEEANQLLALLAGIGQGDWVVLSGSAPPSLGGGFYARLIEVCQAAGAEFVIDTTGEALKAALPSRPLLVKPNHHELAELFGTEINSMEETVHYGRQLLELGAKQVLVSMAGEGALFLTPEGSYHANAPKGTVINSVGAGDSMIGGFMAALSGGADLLTAFRTGVAAGSATAFAQDLATGAEIRALLEQVQIAPLSIDDEAAPGPLGKEETDNEDH